MAKLTLLTTTGQVHQTAGLNWGSNNKNHTTPYDAYIPIHIATIRRNPGLIPPKRPGGHAITITWDDGLVMNCLLEGDLRDSRTGVLYPKQIGSTPHKKTMGKYFRDRLNLPHTHFITLQDLQNYGRTDIDLILVAPDQYTADFSV